MSLALPKLKTSAKSVQTTAEVCADYTCSLYRLQLKSPESTTYLYFVSIETVRRSPKGQVLLLIRRVAQTDY